MSHELEIIDGQAMMFSAEGKVPWHKLGTVIDDDGAKSADALELAGLNWTVEKVPLAQEIGEDEETGEMVYDTIEGWFSVQRSSDLKSVGVVKGRYNPLDNIDAFQLGDDLLDASGAHWITAGSLKGGKQVWMMAKLPESIYIAGMEDEAIQPYIMVSNSHDGTRAVEATVTPIRVVCNNTFTAALSSAKRTFKIRHTKNMSGRINEAKKALDITHAYMAELEALGTDLVNQSFTNAEFDAFLESLVPTADLEKQALTKAQNKQEMIKEIWTNKPDLQNIKNTRWGALQSVIDYHDHHITGRGDNKAEKRMSRILMPMQPNIGHKALDILTTA